MRRDGAGGFNLGCAGGGDGRGARFEPTVKFIYTLLNEFYWLLCNGQPWCYINGSVYSLMLDARLLILC